MVDPAERQPRRQVNATVLHRRDRRPGRIAAHSRREFRIAGDDDVRIPLGDLRNRRHHLAAALVAGDIARAQKGDRLGHHRARLRSHEAGVIASVVDARPRVARDGRDPRCDCGNGVVGDAGEFFSGLGAAEQLAERAIGGRHLVEVAVDQHIGHAAFLLHAFGERLVAVVDVADVDDHIGLERLERVEIDLGVAASGQPRNFRPRGDLRQQKRAGLGRNRFEPAEQQVGRQRIDLDRRRRSSRIDALHVVRHGDAAAGSVGEACGETRQRRGQRRRHAAEQRPAIDPHQISSSYCWKQKRDIEAVERDGHKAALLGGVRRVAPLRGQRRVKAFRPALPTL